MVERFSISKPLDDLLERFSIESSKRYKPRYNASPTQLLPVITLSGKGGLSYFYWGQTPSMAKNKPVGAKWIFTDAQKIFEKVSLKKKLNENRCLIPCDGFYAWKQIGKRKFIPYRIIPLDQSLFSIPGLWEEYEDEKGESIHTFSIIQTQSPQILEAITPSLPIIFYPEDEEIWLDPEADFEGLASTLKSYSNDELSFFTISSKIISMEFDGPELIKPAPASDQHGNYSLFD